MLAQVNLDCRCLLCPVNYAYAPFRLNAQLIQRPDRLNAGEHAKDAIITAPRRLRIEVAAHKRCRNIRSPARPKSEYVPHLVDRDLAF